LTLSSNQPRIGSQRPRLSSVPLYLTSLGQDTVALAKHAGLILDPWQEYVIEESCGLRAGGRWSAMEVGLVVPRQNGKGAVIEARQLGALFLTKDSEITYSAHQMKTSRKMYRRIKKLCRQTPDLNALIAGRFRESNELMGIETDWGILQFVARSKGSGRGFTGNTLFLDEAFDLDPEMLADALPSLSAVPNAQIWYVSSAGMESSEALEKIRARGIAKDRGLAYFEWSSPEGVDLDNDDDALYACNPALGLRIDYDFIRTVERGQMDDEKFGRERFGIWKPPPVDHVPSITAGRWAEMVDVDSPLVGPACLAISSSENNEWWSIASAQKTEAGRIHLEVGKHEQMTRAEARSYVRRVVNLQKPVAVIIERRDPAMIIVPELIKDGIEPETTTVQQHVQACGGFLNDATSNQLSHIGDSNLADAVVGADQKKSSGGFIWVPAEGEVISPLQAATLARWGLIEFESLARVPVQMPTQKPVTAQSRRSETYDLMSVGF
jgi:hypothetical protein